MQEPFRMFARRMANAFGSNWGFLGALAVVVLWAATGPFFGFRDTW
jgi:low affinity Fe/Cu permease